MKILLDEQIHADVKKSLKTTHSIFMIDEMGWKGLQNGELREKLNENDFIFIITADKNLPFQQNFRKMNFTVILIDTPSLSRSNQLLFVPKIQNLLQNPPQPLPKLIHISMRGKKIEGLKKLLPSEQILFL